MYPNHHQITTRGDLRDHGGRDRVGPTHTPSKRDKYDSYTPRKRYIKDQEEYDNYRNLQIQQVPSFPQYVSAQIQPDRVYNSKLRDSSNSKKEFTSANETKIYQKNGAYSPNFEKLYPTDNKAPLTQYNFQPSCPTSVRKTKFKNYAQDTNICKKIIFGENENKNKSNQIICESRNRKDMMENRQRFLDIDNDFNLTPRRLNKKKTENNTEMNEKLSLIQAKIARLERMTPKRSSVPKNTQIIQNAILHEFSGSIVSQKQDLKTEANVSSRVSSVSERQNEIMSRVSLGRLIQEEECETQIEVIQDLSYKISSKLRSIIRNFG